MRLYPAAITIPRGTPRVKAKLFPFRPCTEQAGCHIYCGIGFMANCALWLWQARGAKNRGFSRMYSALIIFSLCNLLYFALHITSGGSFPRPLSAKEEQECFARMKQGDTDARNRLIEHNLRLVAHIIKNK